MTCDMQDDIVVRLVFVVSVQIPIARFVVNLHITYPKGVIDLYFGIKEIGTAIMVMQSGVNHFNNIVISCL